MNPINKQIKLETKARTNHSANDNRNSEPAKSNLSGKILWRSKYNYFAHPILLFGGNVCGLRLLLWKKSSFNSWSVPNQNLAL
jgi:hypothetical protein